MLLETDVHYAERGHAPPIKILFSLSNHLQTSSILMKVSTSNSHFMLMPPLKSILDPALNVIGETINGHENNGMESLYIKLFGVKPAATNTNMQQSAHQERLAWNKKHD